MYLQISCYEPLRRFAPNLKGFVHESPEDPYRISVASSEGTLELSSRRFIKVASGSKVPTASGVKFLLFLHRKKLTSKVQDMEEALQAAELKSQGLEKVKARMNQDLEDLMLDLEKVG